LHTAFDTGKPGSIEPTFRWNEKYGRPIDGFFWWWKSKHQDSWYSGKISDDNTFDLMFVEVDPTHTKVVHAYYTYHMYPKKYSGIASIRDLTQPVPFPKSAVPPPPKKSLWQRIVAHLSGNVLKEAVAHAQEARSIERHRQLTTVEMSFHCKASIGPKVNELAQLLLDQVTLGATYPPPLEYRQFRDLRSTHNPDIYQIV
jgi:hypothetical protein